MSNRFQGKGYKRTRLGSNEWTITMKLPPQLREKFPNLPAEICVRIIRYQIPGFRPSHLITSLLDSRQYSWQDLVQLYHERWRQETAHREWKHSLTLSNIRSHSPEGVRKEVYVQLILNNAIRWLQAEAGGDELVPVELSFIKCKRLAIGASHRMAVVTSACDVLAIYEHLLLNIRRQVIEVRPNRHFKRRKNEKKGRDKGHGKVAQPSQLPPGTVVEFDDAYDAGLLDVFNLPSMITSLVPMTI